MARLPKPGKDDGTWGDILNDFLTRAHNTDGTLKDTGIVADKYVKPDGGIPEDDLDTSVQTKLNVAANDDIVAIAGLSPSNDDVLQRKAGEWINRTPTQLKADLALDNVPNVDARARGSHTGTQTASTISDFNTAVRTNRLDQMTAPTAAVGLNSQKVTDLADGVDPTDATNVGQLAAAIADVETDLASVGTEITDLPTATLTDTSWVSTYTNSQNYAPIVQNGVAKKLPLELLRTMEMTATASISGTTHTWASGQTVLACSNTSPLTITLPTFASSPGIHAPIRVMRLGTGSVTLAAGSSVILNKAASLPLTLRQQYSVAFFMPYFWVGGTTLYLAWGDLG